MKAYFLSSLVLVMLLSSCKGDKSIDETVTEKSKKPFTVTVSAIVEKDDVFQVFYNEDGGESFVPEDAVTINVTGNSQAQELVFTMPEEATPLAIRFDIGANPELKQIVFKGFKMEYLGNKIESSSSEFFRYFYGNTQVEVDTANATAKILLAEGQTYDPILGSTIELKKLIETLYTNKAE